MILRLYWVLGSLLLAWQCRDSEVLTCLFVLQAKILTTKSPRHKGARRERAG